MKGGKHMLRRRSFLGRVRRAPRLFVAQYRISRGRNSRLSAIRVALWFVGDLLRPGEVFRKK